MRKESVNALSKDSKDQHVTTQSCQKLRPQEVTDTPFPCDVIHNFVAKYCICFEGFVVIFLERCTLSCFLGFSACNAVNVCLNGGMCVEEECECPIGYTGFFCETPPPPTPVTLPPVPGATPPPALANGGSKFMRGFTVYKQHFSSHNRFYNKF